MGTGYLIDSNVAIGYLDAKIPAEGITFLHDVINDTPNISIITKIEILSFNAPLEVYKIITAFTNRSVILNLNQDIVDITIELRKAHKIKTPDAIIAATALSLNFTLITRNTSDFKNITALRLLDPWNL
jgi:predicted nucleic acid-binding protein